MNIIEVEAVVIGVKVSSGGFTANKKKKKKITVTCQVTHVSGGGVGSFSSCQNVSSVSDRTRLDDSRR